MAFTSEESWQKIRRYSRRGRKRLFAPTAREGNPNWEVVLEILAVALCVVQSCACKRDRAWISELTV